MSEAQTAAGNAVTPAQSRFRRWLAAVLVFSVAVMIGLIVAAAFMGSKAQSEAVLGTALLFLIPFYVALTALICTYDPRRGRV